jgi:hypothetical protein
MRVFAKCLIGALASAAPFVVPAAAAPIAAPSGLQAAVAATGEAQVETVQWRRGWRAGRWIGPAIVGGAILGAFAATRPWYGYPYYDSYAYAPGYAYSPYSGYAYAPGPAYSYRSADAADVAYCEQRFRSYDRASGTYRGYDGLRHPCP